MKATLEVKKQGKWERHPFTLEVSDICKIFYTSKDHDLYNITKHWNTDETKECPFSVNVSIYLYSDFNYRIIIIIYKIVRDIFIKNI